MTLATLEYLIAEARGLANDHPCVREHAWESEGGRHCPKDLTDGCSQTVYRCARCGEYDYGDKGGPGHRDCVETCRHRALKQDPSA